MDIVTFFLGLSATVAFFIWIHRRYHPNLPPCPAWSVPIFGHLLHIGNNPRSTFKNWRRQCGDIYSLYMGQSLVVVINGYDLLKEALITNEDAFNDRPVVLFDAIGNGKSGIGVAFANGALWKEQRVITKTCFRKLGIHTHVFSEKISEIAAMNNHLIGQHNGQPIDLEEILTRSVTNVMGTVIFGQCSEYNSKAFIKTINYIREILVDADARNLANYFPWLNVLFGDLFKLNTIKAKGEHIIDFLKTNIQKCLSHDTCDDNLCNYITVYNSHMNKKLETGQSTTVSDESLIMSVYHMYAAGLETTSTTLKWCILYFLHYPETQEKVYQEIEREIGIHKPPNMSDKNRLPYLNAFIQETQRISSLFPLGVMRLCSKTTNLRGYTIPKGTQIIPNLDSILHDKKIWGEDVDTFRPERFLNSNGQVIYPEEFVPFSLGKRMCPGASLAKMQLFLFLSLMVQRFKFLESEPGILPTLAPEFGLTAYPSRFQVRAIERSK